MSFNALNFNLLAFFVLIINNKALGSPQYFVPSDTGGGGISLNPGANSWSNFYRYGLGSSSPSNIGNPVVQYHNLNPLNTNPNPNTFDSFDFYPGSQSPSFSSNPQSLDALLMRPLLVIDSRVFAMYQLIKCWEKSGELKKCVKLIEKCDQLFKNKDGEKKKSKKKSKKGKGKKKKGKKKNPDSESTDSQESKDDDDNNEDDDENDEEGEDEDEDDEQD